MVSKLTFNSSYVQWLLNVLGNRNKAYRNKNRPSTNYQKSAIGCKHGQPLLLAIRIAITMALWLIRLDKYTHHVFSVCPWSLFNTHVPMLLTRFKFHISMDKYSHAQ